ncbi:hypothetical protein DRE_02979 [Drechslerella stenobrocha 248]|uniref:CFEM domain-containing protein n=1 Tax=Drechslerella stenobrocha 248 TaxID=1043628 RepID=W7HW72_9PEZI|nr:hypothetical protein DRE_02979 [Drechslerella stenobrocha 248]
MKTSTSIIALAASLAASAVTAQTLPPGCAIFCLQTLYQASGCRGNDERCLCAAPSTTIPNGFAGQPVPPPVQTVDRSAPELDSFPDCGITCLNEIGSQTSCRSGDYGCLCRSSQFNNYFGLCIPLACSPSDYSGVSSAAEDLCSDASAPVTVTVSVTPTATSRPPPVSTATRPARSSTSGGGAQTTTTASGAETTSESTSDEEDDMSSTTAGPAATTTAGAGGRGGSPTTIVTTTDAGANGTFTGSGGPTTTATNGAGQVTVAVGGFLAAAVAFAAAML